VLYLYAVTESIDPPGARGVGGTPVRTVAAGGLAAVISDHPGKRPSAELDDLWAHEEVVEAAMRQGPVLPMRAGSLLESEDEVSDLLSSRGDEFRTALSRVRGGVELGVRLVIADPPPDEPREVEPEGPGTTYLLGRLSQKRQAEGLFERVHSTLRPLASESTEPARAPGSVKVAYLVDETRMPAFRDAVRDLDDELDGAGVLCTGPWPPYSFIGEEAGSR
jgi:hypothetical protein